MVDFGQLRKMMNSFFAGLVEIENTPSDFDLYGRNTDYVARATGGTPCLVKGVLDRAGPDDLESREAMVAFYLKEIRTMSPAEMLAVARANAIGPHKPPTPSQP